MGNAWVAVADELAVGSGVCVGWMGAASVVALEGKPSSWSKRRTSSSCVRFKRCGSS